MKLFPFFFLIGDFLSILLQAGNALMRSVSFRTAIFTAAWSDYTV